MQGKATGAVCPPARRSTHRIDVPKMTQRALQTAQERASEEIVKAEIFPSAMSNRK
jgi:hypothetical protein